MKHFFAGIGEMSCVRYLIFSCISLSPLFHVIVIKSELNFFKTLLLIIGIIYFVLLTFSRIYRKYYYKE
ncbi:hypothetical protein N7659_00590 [Streptococcus sp. CSL10205-OR2]|nr:hypothetical protein [Streptococcus sp. CSL10205-OR2]